MIGPGTLGLAWLLAGCGETPPDPAAAEPTVAEPMVAEPAAEPFVRRDFAPMRDGAPVLEGISYGPFREGQRPGGPSPTPEQILEDLRILAPHFGMIRVYSAREPTETVLRTIAEHQLPIRVLVGAWIAPDADEDNTAEVESAVRLANAYPEQVFAVSVGNETQVSWSGHRSDREALRRYIASVRSRVTQPVTTADDYNFWNKPEAGPVAAEIDFLCLHAYAMWNGQTLDEAIAWTARTYQAIAALHPEHPVVLCETGWATTLNPDGNEAKHVKAPAGEAEQARFFAEYRAWAEREEVPTFWFEAFDEPWKGSSDPDEIEKHWGLYRVDRTPKAAVAGPP